VTPLYRHLKKACHGRGRLKGFKGVEMKATKTILFVVFMIGFAGILHKPIFSADIWHHLKIGEYVVQHHYELPKVDPFCYTTQGKPLVHHEWLSQIILYHMHDAFGFGGIRALRDFLLLGVLAMVFWIAYRHSGFFPVALLVLCVVVYLIRTRYMIRPELFSLFFFTLFYAWFITWQRKFSVPTYVIFFLLCVFWINLHPLMLLFGAFLLITCTSQIGKRLPWMRNYFHFSDPPYNPVVLLSLFLIASLITPHGYKIYQYVFHATPLAEKYIQEWQSVFVSLQSDSFKTITGGVLAFPVIMKGLIVGIIGLFLLVLAASYGRGIKWELEDLLWGLLVGYMALKSARFMWLLFIPALLIVKYGKALFHQDALSKKFRSIGSVLLWTGLAVALFYWIGEAYQRIPHHLNQQIESHRYPETPVEIIKKAGLAGTLYNPNGWGGYLIYHLYPDVSPFIDTRSYLHGEDHVLAAMMIQYQYPGFEKLLNQYAFDILLFKKMYGITRPFDYPNWVLLFEDPNSAMYLKKNDRNVENLGKITDYFEKKRIPFDAQKGFDQTVLKEKKL
jgi:hypothetical protein